MEVVTEKISAVEELRAQVAEQARFERLMMDDFPFFVKMALRIIDKGRMLTPSRGSSRISSLESGLQL